MAGDRRCPGSRCARPCRSDRVAACLVDERPVRQPEDRRRSPANVLSPELTETAVAWGSLALDGGTSAVPYYGYDGFTAPTVLTQNVNEAHKTEPDKNTYLVLKNGQPGADPDYDYGTHFLFQGHESGAPGCDHARQPRRRRGAPRDAAGDGGHRALLPTSTARPGTRSRSGCCSPRRTAAPRAAYWQPPDYPATRRRHLAARSAAAATRASRPTATATSGSSRTSAAQRHREHHGQAAQQLRLPVRPGRPDDLTRAASCRCCRSAEAHGTPIAFHAGQADGRHPRRRTSRDLHTYGATFTTRWVTIHDTATDGTTPFNANALAKAARRTPFKRPRTACSGRAASFRRVLLHRDR